MRILLISLCVFLFSCKTERNAGPASGDPVRIPGTRIFTVIPDGFELTYGAPQLRNETGCGFEFWEYPIGFEQLSAVEGPESYANNPFIKWVQKEEKEYLGYPAIEVIKETYFNGDSLRRQTLIFGDSTFCATNEFSYPIDMAPTKVSGYIENLGKVIFEPEQSVDPYEHLAFDLALEGDEAIQLTGTTPTGVYFSNATGTNLSLAYVENRDQQNISELEQFKSLFDPIRVIPEGIEITPGGDIQLAQSIDTGSIDGRKWIDGCKYTLYKGDTMDITNLQILFTDSGNGIALSGRANFTGGNPHESFRDFMKKVKPKSNL